MSGTEIRTAQDSERSHVVATIASGFEADPVVRWCLPEEATRQEALSRFIDAYGGRAFEHDSAWTDEGFRGAALWLPPGVTPDEEEVQQVVTSTMPEEKQGPLFAAMEELGSYYPEEPHWFLPTIGVDPAWQGRGIGSRLMKHAVDKCDDAGKRAYLESSNPRNISLYERHGFKVVGEVRSGDCPVFTPMVREPLV